MRCRETMLCATCTTFSTRGNFYVSPISFENTLKNWHLKNKQKTAILNGCISKARANSESKLIFSESSFNFLQKSLVFLAAPPIWVHGRGLCPLQPPCRCQRLAVLKELSCMYEKSKWINSSFILTYLFTKDTGNNNNTN